MPTNLDIIYALGVSCFPIIRYGKTPYRGFLWEEYQERRPTPEEIDRWNHDYPTCNVAIVTGRISGCIVLDCDGAKGEREIAAHGGLPWSAAVRTYSGTHYYFTYPAEPITPAGIISSRVRLLPDLDLRADGGYVLAPGSAHRSGHIYSWIREPASPANRFLHPPDWLIVNIQEHTQQGSQGPGGTPTGGGVGVTSFYGRTALQQELARLNTIPLEPGHGKQAAMNTSAFRMGQLIGGGYLDESIVVHELAGIWARWGKPVNLGHDTISRGIADGRKQPRHVTTARR